MKKKQLIFGILLIVIISLIIIFSLTKNKSLEEKIEDCSKDPACLTKLAVENLDDRICIEIGDKYPAGDCMLEVTISKGNITECGKFRFQEERDYCESQILNK